MTGNNYMTQTQLAERWKVAESTLERWRIEALGPQVTWALPSHNFSLGLYRGLTRNCPYLVRPYKPRRGRVQGVFTSAPGYPYPLAIVDFPSSQRVDMAPSTLPRNKYGNHTFQSEATGQKMGFKRGHFGTLAL